MDNHAMIMARYEAWTARELEDEALTQELASIRDHEEEIKDRFYRSLEFGTAGIRGVLGAGTNRMNIYTVRQATQGLADYLNSAVSAPSVAIAYDSRVNSELFAREAACVLAGNGVRVHLYKELMPTPALSYAVRELGCDSGVVITASHNPAKYNGYKAYGSDGCQMSPEIADKVYRIIQKTDIFDGVKRVDLETGLSNGLISYIPDSLIEKYYSRVLRERVNVDAAVQAGLSVVYTPLNGAGNRPVREIFRRMGLSDVTVVPEQEHPDGNFPTCPYPNPELPEAVRLAADLARKRKADLVIATDPDCDRVAVAVRQGEELRSLTGNETGVLLLDYIAKARLENNTMPPEPVAVTSIVSTRLAAKVAKTHGVRMVDVLTGFKFIGEVILGLEEKGEEDRYIFGFEESCGYLSGSYVRDKDAVNGSMLIAEMASYYKLRGKTLVDVLDGLYRQYGIHYNTVDNFAFEGADGMSTMMGLLRRLREERPGSIAGTDIVCWSDYESSEKITAQGTEIIRLPKSNVLEYTLANGCDIIIRPSGTEPKLKIYYSIVADSREKVDHLVSGYQSAVRRLLGIDG